MFHCFTLHRLDTFCWFGVGCVVWGGCLVCLVCFLFFFCAQSVRPRYQSMTSIAYLHDCHCCHNERSIVQKKKVNAFASTELVAGSEGAVLSGVVPFSS